MATQTPDTNIAYSDKLVRENSSEFARAFFVRYYEKMPFTTVLDNGELHDLISDYIIIRYRNCFEQSFEQVDTKWREIVPKLNNLLDTFFAK